jgi:organic radical activating enzyme
MEIVIKSIHNKFQTLGINAGKYCTFVKISGCNLKCSFCNSFNITDKTNIYTINSLLTEILKFTKDTKHVVFTGGEPLIYKTQILFLALELKLNNNIYVELETNGTINLSEAERYIYNSIILSPKAWIDDLRLKECTSLILLYPYKYTNVYPSFAEGFYKCEWKGILPIDTGDSMDYLNYCSEIKEEVKRLGNNWRICYQQL